MRWFLNPPLAYAYACKGSRTCPRRAQRSSGTPTAHSDCSGSRSRRASPTYPTRPYLLRAARVNSPIYHVVLLSEPVRPVVKTDSESSGLQPLAGMGTRLVERLPNISLLERVARESHPVVSLHASAAVDALVHVVVRVGVEAHVARELAHTARNGRGGRGCALPLELLVQFAKLELRGGALHRATEACP